MKYIICIFLIVISILISNLFLYKLPDNFFQVNIAQVLTPIVQIFIAIGIAIFVNIQLSNKNKKHELFLELIDDYDREINKLHTKALKYMESKDLEYEQKILSLLTSSSQKLSLLQEVKIEYKLQNHYSSDQMRTEFIEYKKRLTIKSFKQNTSYELLQKKSVTSAYNTIHGHIVKEKISLYK